MQKFPKILKILIIIVGLAVIAGGITGGVLYAVYKNKGGSKTGIGAIASNGVECAEMGKKIFEIGGNVADAAVTTYLCEGVSSPASCGIGGGFILTIYLKDKGTVQVLNARERAPRNATADMFIKNPNESYRGGKAVAVPGGLKGIWELHQKYGSLKWKDLLQPVIDMCRNGHIVNEFLEEMLDDYEDDILAEPSMAEIFVNPSTGKVYRKGEVMKRLKMAETLEVIAKEGIDPIYGGGDIGKKLIQDIQKYGGVMIEKDLKDYRVEWSDPLSLKIINNHTVYTSPLPTSGSMLLFLLNLFRNDQISPNLTGYQRMIEGFKFAFAHRSHIGTEENQEVFEMLAKMEDPKHADEIRKLIKDTTTSNDIKYYGAKYQDIDDRGTAHLSILAPNGDAIALTDTINDIFGAMFRSQSTGIILNDEMDDFSVPRGANSDGLLPSPNNFVIPGNNPLSSMIPTIVLDGNGDVRLLIGAAGGRTIVTATYYVLYRNIFFNETLEKAISAPRFHHQLSPMELGYQQTFDTEIIKALNQNIGHTVRSRYRVGNVVAVAVENGKVLANYEPTRGGSTVIFDGHF